MLEIAQIFELDMLMQGYLLLKILDFITGFLKAYKIEGFKSRKIRDGVVMFIGELVAVTFGGVFDLILGVNGVIILPVKCMLIYKEGVSISENLTAIGVSLPDIVTNHLEDFIKKNKSEKARKEDE